MHFECRRCGRCCSPEFFGPRQGGIVNITPEEQARAAEFLGLTLDEFRANHINGNGTISLVHVACSLLVTDSLGKHHCKIHEVKPASCAKWPWTERNKTLEGARESARLCPGCVVEED